MVQGLQSCYWSQSGWPAYYWVAEWYLSISYWLAEYRASFWSENWNAVGSMLLRKNKNPRPTNSWASGGRDVLLAGVVESIHSIFSVLTSSFVWDICWNGTPSRALGFGTGCRTFAAVSSPRFDLQHLKIKEKICFNPHLTTSNTVKDCIFPF